MRYKYDSGVDALRIYVQDGEFDDTIEVAPDLFVDYDKNKNILSIEVLDASKILKEIEDRHPDESRHPDTVKKFGDR